jgi:hypothetical protein
LRTLEELTDPELLAWVGLNSITVQRGNFQPEKLRVGVSEDTPSAVKEAVNFSTSWDDYIFWHLGLDKAFSWNDIYRMLDLGEMYASLAKDNRRSRRGTLVMEFPDRDIALVVRGARVPMEQLQVTGVFSVEVSDVPLAAVYRYVEGEGEDLAESVEVEVDVEGTAVMLSMHRIDNGDGTQSLTAVAFCPGGEALPDLELTTVVEIDGRQVEFRTPHREIGASPEDAGLPPVPQ